MRLSRPSAPALLRLAPYDSSGATGDSSTRIGAAGASSRVSDVCDSSPAAVCNPKGDPPDSDRNGDPLERARRRESEDVATENTHTTAKSSPDTSTRIPKDPIPTDTAVAHALPRAASPTIEKTTAHPVVTARSKRMENWGTSMKPIMTQVSGDGKRRANAVCS